jgi:hypothetical protein
VTDAGPNGAAGPRPLAGLFQAHWRRITLTYALFNVENLLHLAQPLVLGLAINGLLQSSYAGLGLLAAQHVAHLFVGTARRLYDTRVFTSIYTDLAAGFVARQREAGADVSAVAARSALAHELVDFFERDVPLVFASAYAVAGALVMLVLYDGLLPVFCLLTLVPLVVLNHRLARDSHGAAARLNDQLEREVGVIDDGRADAVRDHYRALARWQVRLSDLAALNFTAMEFFVLGLIAAALARYCSLPGVAAGDIYAVFAYVLTFVGGLDNVPLVTQQLARLHDIGRRVAPDAGGAGNHAVP